jgi:hypothetical protein
MFLYCYLAVVELGALLSRNLEGALYKKSIIIIIIGQKLHPEVGNVFMYAESIMRTHWYLLKGHIAIRNLQK